MTKHEFEAVFNATREATLNHTANAITSNLKQYADGKNTISTEDLAGAILLESFKMNTTFLKQLLENVLEFSD